MEILRKLFGRKKAEVEREPKEPEQKYYGIANEDIPLYGAFQEWLKNELELNLLDTPFVSDCMIIGTFGKQRVIPPWVGNPYSEIYGTAVIKYIDTHPKTPKIRKSVLYTIYYWRQAPEREGHWEDFLDGMYKIIRKLDEEGEWQ